MISVIVPAHNEAAVLPRLLWSLQASAGVGSVQVHVIANGCTDETAQAARHSMGNADVLETKTPSKINALNLGDARALGFPRFYIDADVQLDERALHDVTSALSVPGVLAAAPRMIVDCSGRWWGMRAYYDIWLRLPYCQSGMIGSGCYAVSEAGRRRWEQFPDITADDAYVRLQFRPNERVIVQSCSFTVTPPKTLRKLISIKTRSHFGNAELKQRFPELLQNEEVRHEGVLLRLARNPMRWPALGVYMFVKLATRWKVRQRFKKGELKIWERDDSSRETHSASGST